MSRNTRSGASDAIVVTARRAVVTVPPALALEIAFDPPLREDRQALYRNAALDAKRIEVTVTGSVVHLRGTATSWLQRDAAERAAYDAPGITVVDNQIVVDPPNDDNCEIC